MTNEIEGLISVVLPAYNAESYIGPAVDSILAQTYSNIELICIDDGSTDNTLNILNTYEDERLRIVSRENRGLIHSLNEGIALSRGRYIARMDADDISLPDRLEKQLDLMRKRHLGVVGSSYSYIDDSGVLLRTRILPESPLLNAWLLDFGSSLCHPAVMFDRKVVDDQLYYDPEAEACEDYDLWLRIRSHGISIGNVKEILLNYRVLDTSISRTKLDIQKAGSINALLKHEPVYNRKQAEFLLSGAKPLPNLRLISGIVCCGLFKRNP
ncbi:glycosyltransferase family 2 protein, partial [Thalassolituus sp. UBA1505]|uniref:glycosyltransferase family 2 protein n=1 Tax=Thalassolituus sp. UBA1505 TaxID=1947653 RepID=UPI0025EDEE73